MHPSSRHAAILCGRILLRVKRGGGGNKFESFWHADLARTSAYVFWMDVWCHHIYASVCGVRWGMRMWVNCGWWWCARLYVKGTCNVMCADSLCGGSSMSAQFLNTISEWKRALVQMVWAIAECVLCVYRPISGIVPSGGN